MDDKLLQLYFEGYTTGEQSRLITEWLEVSDVNMKHYQHLCRLYEISFWHEKTEPVALSLKRKPKWRSFLQEAMKVAVVFILGFALNHYLNPEMGKEKDTVMQTMHVPAGQNAQLTLADGSKVWLNAGSTLHFPDRFAEDKRQVTLEGEGFFELKTDEGKPFIVSTANYDIKALGTSFNVKAYKQSAKFETALLTGKVEISDHATNRILSLTPHNRAVLTTGGLSVVPILNTDYFLWRQGILYFDEPLMEVLKKLELYFDVSIQVDNKSVLQNKRHSTAKFRTRDGLYHILDVLQLTHHFAYKRYEEGNRVVIY